MRFTLFKNKLKHLFNGNIFGEYSLYFELFIYFFVKI